MATTSALLYLDVSLGEEDPDARNPPSLSTTVTKTSNIVENAADWYIAISRFSINVAGLPQICPLMLNNGTADAPVTTDGVSLAEAVTVTYYSAPGVGIAVKTVNLRLPKDPGEVIAPLVWPEPAGYSWLNWPEWVAALNEATAVSFNALHAALAPITPWAGPPSFSINGGYLCQVLPSSALYDWAPGATYPRIAVEGNAHLYSKLRGLAVSIHPTAPPERSIRLSPECEATAWLGAAPTGLRVPPAVSPPVAFTSTSTELLPSNVGARSLEIRTSLPVLQEVAASPSQRVAVLSDFILSSVDTNETQGIVSYVAGAGLGTARFAKLVGGGPIASFRVEAHWRNDRGQSFPIPAGWGRSTMRIAFARNHVVEGGARP